MILTRHIASCVTKTLVLVGVLWLSGPVKADHILGGEITYTQLFNKQYKFQLKLYRNCNGCEFNADGCADIKNLDIFLSPEVSPNVKKLGSIDLQKIGRKNITPTCAYAKFLCDGSTSAFGIEEWVWEGEFDFATLDSEYCDFEIGIRVEARDDVYGLGTESYYNYCRLNVCKLQRNNSPKYNAPAFFVLPFDQSFTYNPLITDPDGDSISYTLVKAQKNFNTSISYPVMYSETKPLSVLCPAGNCTLDKKSWPVQGIGLDERSGWMGFTPQVKGQKGFFVLQITEWRRVGSKMIKVGITRRDLQFEVVDMLNNATRINPTQYKVNACAGDQLFLDYNVNDPSAGGKTDTVDLKFFSNLPNSSIGKVPFKPNNFDGWFTADISKTLSKNHSYFVTLISNDNHCPLQSVGYRTIEIKIYDKPEAGFKLSNPKCNKLQVASDNYANNETHAWFLLDQLGFVASSPEEMPEFEVQRSGRYYVVHQVTNKISGCMTEMLDSIDIANFSLLSFKGNWPDKSCQNNTLSLNADLKGGIAPMSYFWNGSKGAKQYSFLLIRDTIMNLDVVDARGCELNYQKKISLFPVSYLVTTDTSLCFQAGSTLALNSRFTVLPLSNHSEELQKVNGNGLLNKIGNSYFYKPGSAGIVKFILSYTDDNLCLYLDSFIVHFEAPLPTGIDDIDKICDNHNSFDLSRKSGLQLSGGAWSSVKPGIVDQGLFYPKLSGEGQFKVYYTNSHKGCIFQDSAMVNVYKAPTVKINGDRKLYLCENSKELPMTASPASGQWYNTGANGLFSPEFWFAKGTQDVKVHYYYMNPGTGCSNTDSVQVRINALPSMKPVPNGEICSGESYSFNAEIYNTEKFSLQGNWADWKLERHGNHFELRSPNLQMANTYCGTFLLVPLQGCAAQQFPLCIKVKPRPGGNLVSDKIEGCVPFPVNVSFQNNSSLVPDSYTWTVAGTAQTGTDKFFYNFKQATIADIKLRYSLDGCEGAEKSLTVNAYENIQARIEVEPRTRVMTMDYPHFTFNDASVSKDAHTVQWFFQNATPSTSGLSRIQVEYPKVAGSYYVEMRSTTAEGCEDKTYMEVKIVDGFRLYVPTAFSPDGKAPEKNEKFTVVTDSCNQFSLVIRNKWNEIFFRSNDQYAGWDGTYLGKSVPVGVYIYTVSGQTIFGRTFEQSGNLTLLR